MSDTKDQVVEFRHTYASDYTLKPATAAVLHPYNPSKIDISFIADRTICHSEAAVRHPENSSLIRPGGEMRTEVIREHQVGVTMTEEGIRGLYAALAEIIGMIDSEKAQKQ
jgi:hypothetical protein